VFNPTSKSDLLFGGLHHQLNTVRADPVQPDRAPETQSEPLCLRNLGILRLSG
jgi:hypothetical protein